MTPSFIAADETALIQRFLAEGYVIIPVEDAAGLRRSRARPPRSPRRRSPCRSRSIRKHFSTPSTTMSTPPG